MRAARRGTGHHPADRGIDGHGAIGDSRPSRGASRRRGPADAGFRVLSLKSSPRLPAGISMEGVADTYDAQLRNALAAHAPHATVLERPSGHVAPLRGATLWRDAADFLAR